MPRETWLAGRRSIFLRSINFILRMPGHRARIELLRRLAGARVGSDVTLERGCRLLSRGGLVIGDRTIINEGAVLDARGGLHIGSDVNVSPRVTFLTASHDPDSPEFAAVSGSVHIGSHAWIASQAVVLPGCRIGEGAVVAAGSVVTKDVPAWTIVGGNPARRIRDRQQHAQQRLVSYRRWLT